MRKLRLASMVLKGLAVKELLDKFMFLKDLGQYKDNTVEAAKLQSYIVYLKSIRTMRLLFISILGIGFCLLLLVSGIFLFHLSLLLYGPWSNNTKMIITLVSAAIYIGGSIGVFIYIFSQKKWMEIFNADDIVEKVKEKTSAQQNRRQAKATRTSSRIPNGNGVGADI